MSVETSHAVRLAREPLRREAFAWQRAAWGLLTVAVATNTALWGLLSTNFESEGFF